MNFEAVTTPASSALYQAFEALQGAARCLSAQDVSNAEMNLAEVRYRPLTQLCAEGAAALQGYLEENVGLVTGEHVGMGHDAGVVALKSAPE
jgi:hypothetical protein